MYARELQNINQIFPLFVCVFLFLLKWFVLIGLPKGFKVNLTLCICTISDPAAHRSNLYSCLMFDIMICAYDLSKI